MKQPKNTIAFGVVALGLFVGVWNCRLVPAAASAENKTKTDAIQWTPCEDAPATPLRECAVVPVPLDYANSSLGTTELQLARMKASDPDVTHHKGTLVFVPGGPPSAGVNYVGYTGNMNRWIAPEIQAAYDVVGIQQIGSWDGTPCISGEPLKQYWEANHLPKNTAELHTVMGMEKAYNDGCTKPGNALVPYMNTARSVRDMETVRQMLGVEKVSFMAYSYGTALTHAYMSEYPSHVYRVVMDSVLDRSQPDPVQSTENNIAWDKSWQLFKEWCQSNVDCPLKGQNLDRVFDKTVAIAGTTGIPAPRNPFGNRPLNDWELTLAVQALTGAGEATRIWAATILNDAAAGDGSQAEFIYDLLTGRRLDGTYVGGDGTRRAYACNDTVWSRLFRTPEDVRSWALATQLVAPKYGATSVYQGVAQCYGWSLAPIRPQPHYEPVPEGVGGLLINADNDASTPLLWAKRVQKQIPGSKLVVVSGASHLQSIKSRCAMAYAENYLLSGTLPADEASCSYDADLNPPQLPPDLGAASSRSQTVLPGIPSEIIAQLRELR